MNSGSSDNPKWKFDPNTGEPVADNTSGAETPAERPSYPHQRPIMLRSRGLSEPHLTR